ncbi:MAG: diacylglycerol kinase family lipid kinase [Clostridiales bacterium]|nr:diacylglycerol kinase family lipid kinase [Clostridiales bacterium]
MYHVILNGNNINEKTEAKIETVRKVFRTAGKDIEVHSTAHAGHAKNIATELTANGEFAHLIAMGGDGTLHEVLNGISDAENCTLGLIPLGSGNDFAETAGISHDVKTAAETIAFRAPTFIDYIELDSGLRSINAVGMGIDVDVLQRAYAGKARGKSKYFKAFLKSLKYYKASTFKASWDGGDEREYTGIIACLGNGRQIGGGIKLFPDAEIDDGYMDLLVVDYLSKFRTLVAFLKLNSGKVNKVKEVTHVKCKSARITPINGGAPIQAEGEIYENVPLNARIVSNKLKFYLPSKIDN